MGRTCAVVSCTNDQTIHSTSFFKFKKEKEWLNFLKAANGEYKWEEVNGMVLCSDHFSPDVIIESWGRHRVTKNGYPTLVAGENIVQNLKVSQETVIEESGSCEITCEDDTCHCGAAARVTEQNIIIQNLSKELAEMKSYADELSTLLETARSQLNEKRNTVRTLNQKERRRERKHEEGKQKRKLEEETETMTKKTKLDEEDRQKALLNELLTRTGANTKSPFSYMLREFSFELHYYSPRAYNYVRSYDSLNSKSTGSRYKSPIHAGNLNMYKKFFTEAKQYFSSLKVYIHGKPKLLLHTGRKTSLVGLITTITSIENIMEEIISNENEYLKFLPVYKLSQDLVEMFFSTLRSRFGYNNNPNAKQIQQAMKGILCMNARCINTGNCIEQEETTTRVSPLKTLTAICNDEVTTEAVEEEFDNEEDEVDMYIPSNEEASFINNIIAYIAGYVVRKICTSSSCPRCICKLMADENDVPKIADDCVLILKKDNGGLILPSHVVISVCKLTEHRVREVKANGLRKMKKKNLVDYVLSQSRERNLIHDFQCNSDEIGTAHACSLVRQIASIYLTARMHHLAKETTFQLCPTTVRSTCVNVVQFKGQ